MNSYISSLGPCDCWQGTSASGAGLGASNVQGIAGSRCQCIRQGYQRHKSKTCCATSRSRLMNSYHVFRAIIGRNH
ncbi:MAG: hypothetical protein EZS28_031494 [Streblomastix strix]|uniref:Uncharacterized protein n=1 Tax=Streblomastix strix TaxID=222440 RepID=A0A5J4URA5_9EUKA|nr:MAG: hypothetical protein EZS28_031494 [Streblomastix strix]